MADRELRNRCAQSITGAPEQVRAVQRIQFRGTPAYVFIFGSGASRKVYVVGDTCGSQDSAPLLYSLP
jgi:hypothetical protein